MKVTKAKQTKQMQPNTVDTYTTAAHEDYDKRLEPASNTDHPDQTDEQDHSEYVLDAREIDAKNCTKLSRLVHTHKHTNTHTHKHSV